MLVVVGPGTGVVGHEVVGGGVAVDVKVVVVVELWVGQRACDRALIQRVEETAGLVRVVDGGEDARAAIASRADEDLACKGAAEEPRPIDARCAREERSLIEALAMRRGDARINAPRR